MDRERIVGLLAAMTDDEFRQLAAEARPPTPTDPASARASIAAKAQAMWDTPRDHNGPTGPGSFAAAAAARGPARQPPPELTPQPQPAPPQPQQPTAPTGFSTNRAQGASSSDWAPVNERDLNKQKISDILQRRQP
jgi:hypothetical protein